MTEQKHSVFIITLSLVIINLLTICCADAPELKPVEHHDLVICKPERFQKLNLSMSELAFCDKTLPYQVRAKDLIDRMTLREKAQQLGHKSPGVPRLGLPRYNWWSEGLHGVSYIGNGTNFTDIIPTASSFPTVIHTTASFNKSLWKTIGKAVSTEARAFHNVQQGGLTYWSPVINPVRDPRWGRTSETPGLDLDCGDFFPDYLENSVKQGKVRESEMDKALNHLYVVLMRLGLFDGSDPSLMKIGKNEVCSQEHIELAAEAAREGIVLLKNDAETLPFTPDSITTLAVIGPNANVTRVMLGNYEAAFPCRYVTPIMGLSAFAQVLYENGCEDTSCNHNKTFPRARAVAKLADATVLIMGSDRNIEDESLDRESLLLPGLQTELITQVSSNSKGPVILVLMTAGGFDISFAVKDPKIKAILWVGHPGQEGGRAIADVIFGNYNPGGRLPITWYQADYVDKLPMTSMPLRPIDSQGYPGRTYKFFNGTTVFPFGYGLSYTTFSYKKNVSFGVEVKNQGDKDGSEVIIVYSKPPEGIVGTHIKQVVEFERVYVPAKQITRVKFDLNVCKSFSIVDSSAYTVLPSGTHKILLGTSDSEQQIDVDIIYSIGNAAS
ncbi:hypothetical protein COLO4_19314 [Corchorus olitorius]|uniref:Fibronectin type III-like domain-containing protein n=1 Tax=Corchorus olitorius TaxID=93759 RepID=A0A1R3J5W8_9ROSI|nr:hypothetical protein COLO4_19314 [Corchorus olitorius]